MKEEVEKLNLELEDEYVRRFCVSRKFDFVKIIEGIENWIVRNFIHNVEISSLYMLIILKYYFHLIGMEENILI